MEKERKLKGTWPAMQPDGGVRLRISYLTCEIRYIPAEKARGFMDAYESGEFEGEIESGTVSVEQQPDGGVKLETSYISHEIRDIPAEKARSFWANYKSGKYAGSLRAEIAKFNEHQDGENDEA